MAFLNENPNRGQRGYIEIYGPSGLLVSRRIGYSHELLDGSDTDSLGDLGKWGFKKLFKPFRKIVSLPLTITKGILKATPAGRLLRPILRPIPVAGKMFYDDKKKKKKKAYIPPPVEALVPVEVPLAPMPTPEEQAEANHFRQEEIAEQVRRRQAEQQQRQEQQAEERKQAEERVRIREEQARAVREEEYYPPIMPLPMPSEEPRYPAEVAPSPEEFGPSIEPVRPTFATSVTSPFESVEQQPREEENMARERVLEGLGFEWSDITKSFQQIAPTLQTGIRSITQLEMQRRQQAIETERRKAEEARARAASFMTRAEQAVSTNWPLILGLGGAGVLVFALVMKKRGRK